MRHYFQLLSAMMLTALLAAAQDKAPVARLDPVQLSGTVVDTSGAPISAAVVQVQSCAVAGCCGWC